MHQALTRGGTLGGMSKSGSKQGGLQRDRRADTAASNFSEITGFSRTNSESGQLLNVKEIDMEEILKLYKYNGVEIQLDLQKEIPFELVSKSNRVGGA